MLKDDVLLPCGWLQGLHHMTYDDGETEWLDMRKETKCPCNPGDAEPPPPPPTPVRAAAAVRRQPDTTAGAGGSPGSSNQPDSKGKSSSVKPASEDAMMKLIRKQRTNLTQLCSYWQQVRGGGGGGGMVGVHGVGALGLSCLHLRAYNRSQVCL